MSRFQRPGRNAFAPLDRRSQRDAGATLEKLKPADQARLVAAMNTIETLLGDRAQTPPVQASGIKLREPVPGDFGWIINTSRRALRAGIRLGRAVRGRLRANRRRLRQQPRSKARTVLDRRNRRRKRRHHHAGEGFAKVARIRLLLLEPNARGIGLGARWSTNASALRGAQAIKKSRCGPTVCLLAARHIYQKVGFKLMRTERHRSWGQPVVSEHWDLIL